MLAHQKATGEQVQELIPVPIPKGCEELWSAFMQLHATRANNGMGISGIGWADMLAWQQMNGVTLTPWEIDAILQLDRVAVSCINKAQKENAP